MRWHGKKNAPITFFKLDSKCDFFKCHVWPDPRKWT
jgi:hypothetical protein